MSFRLDAFLPQGHDLFPIPAKADYSDTINLASNEFYHTGLAKLLEEFCKQYPVKKLVRYPYWENCHLKLAEFYQVDVNNLVVTAGSDQAIAILLNYLTAKQKKLIIQNPNFYNYYNYARVNRLQIIPVEFLNVDDQVFVDNFNLVLKNTEPALVVITTPEGFTGRILNNTLVESILSVAYQYNHLVVIDEAYCDFSPYNHLALIKQYSNLLILRSFSKGFGMAGLRLGVMLGNPEIIAFIKKIGILGNVTNFTMDCAVHLLDNYAIVETARREVLLAKEIFIKGLKSIFFDWQIMNGFGNFIAIALPDVQQAEAVHAFFKKQGIMIKNLSAISGLEGVVRISLAQQDVMDKTLNLFKKYKEQFALT